MQCPNCGFAVSPVLYRCGNCNDVLPPPPGVIPMPVQKKAPVDRRLHSLGGAGTATMVVIWLAALAWVVNLTPQAFAIATDDLSTAPSVLETLVGRLVCLGLSLAAWVLFIVWLFLARRNIDLFPEAMPQWGLPWTVTAWFVPVGSVLIGPAVVADVARNSVDDFGEYERRRLADRVWAWWILYLLAVVLPVVIGLWPAVVGFAFLLEIMDTGVYVSPALIALLASAVCGVVAAIAACRVITGVDAGHRERVERDWAVTAAPKR